MNFRKQHSIEPTPLQLAPLVDVLLLLVIFFAVTSHYASVEQIMDVSVPAADTGKEDRARNVGEIIVNIKADGGIIVNGKVVSGVGGGIVALVPGECGICVWSPALEPSGNSLAGSMALEWFTTLTGRSLF